MSPDRTAPYSFFNFASRAKRKAFKRSIFFTAASRRASLKWLLGDAFCCTALSPKMAQSGHPDTLNQCPLSGVQRIRPRYFSSDPIKSGTFCKVSSQQARLGRPWEDQNRMLIGGKIWKIAEDRTIGREISSPVHFKPCDHRKLFLNFFHRVPTEGGIASHDRTGQRNGKG